jgi:hypothetical protein
MALVNQLVDKALAAAAAVHQQVLQLFESVQMALELRVAPAAESPHLAPAEAIVAPRHRQLRAGGRHHLVEQQQELARLRRQLVKRSAQHLAR